MSNIDNTATEKLDVYRKVTDQIVTVIERGVGNSIEQGVGNSRMPWHTSGRFAFSPINVVRKRPYRGINTVCLWAAAQAKGLRLRRVGYLPTMAGTRGASPHG
jgi:antirestriction protein ArdC